MARVEPSDPSVPRRWGDAPSPADDDEARRRLVEAAARCIVRRGDAQIRMAEVADEAGVARSTLYRYFATRADLIVGMLIARAEPALESVVRSLRDPDDAATSLPDLILEPIGMVEGNPLNEALYSPASSAGVSAIQLGSEAMNDVAIRHFAPLLERWQGAGQLHADLDVPETIRWMNAIALTLLAPPWRRRSAAEKQVFLERYLVRALVPRSDNF